MATSFHLPSRPIKLCLWVACDGTHWGTGATYVDALLSALQRVLVLIDEGQKEEDILAFYDDVIRQGDCAYIEFPHSEAGHNFFARVADA